MSNILRRVLSALTASAAALSVALFDPSSALGANAIESFQLKVCGTYVTDDNCSDVLGNGNVSYDESTQTLHIKGELKGQIDNSAISGLTISVDDDCSLTNDLCAMFFFRDTTITGKGTLTVKTTLKNESCIHLQRGCTLTLKDVNLNVTGTERGITGWGNGNSLSVINSNVTASANGWAVGYFTGGISLKDADIVSPTGCTVMDGYLCDGSSYAKTVKITASGKPRRLLGDLNSDGIITVEDAIIAARYAAGYNGYQEKYDPEVGDMNGDKKVTAEDAVIIARCAAGYGNYKQKYSVYI